MQLLPKFSSLSDVELTKLMRENKIGMTVDEARKIEKELGRALTLTEAVLWGIQGSEHCSYKSSRNYLKLLPTKASNVILGPGEDSGIVEITSIGSGKNKDRYGIVVSHESHNHPSQIVPYEGAATGIGGCVRDVACMGAKVIANLDPLRFGDIKKNECRQIAKTVVSGIGGYGNPIGVPCIGGDAYFEKDFNDNCLVNVATIGVIKESHVIHSYVSKKAAEEKWDIIIVGKPTDMSGMGGAAFASLVLDESEKEKNKGAVQEPNPFLKRHLLVSSYDLFKELQEQNLIDKVSFKDMGAGGISCSTVEQVAKVGLGAEIHLDKVNVALEGLEPAVIACAETQERFTWMCHPSLTQKILDHYNKKWDLPNIAENARAVLAGKVIKGNYILKYKGETVVDAPATLITEGLLYDRPYSPSKKSHQEPNLKEPNDYNKVLLELLSSENIANRKPIYEKYDKQVQGYVVIEAGQADAGVMVPLLDEKVPAAVKKIGMAFKVDGNPRQALISPFHAARNAAVECMRNVAAVGAYPQAFTNCLNYGNPEKPEQMWELVEGIKGLAEACNGVKLKNHRTEPTPIISGNVSLYNEGKSGHIPPSCVVCCIGKIDDAYKAVDMQFKKAGSKIYLIGARKDEMGASEYYRLHSELGKNVPVADLNEVQNQIYAVTDLVAAGLVNSVHDISEGGLAVAVSEMCFGGWGKGKIGAKIDLENVLIETNCCCDGKSECTDEAVQLTNALDVISLFSETGGFVLEVNSTNEKKFLKTCEKYCIDAMEIGKTTKEPRLVFESDSKIIDLPLQKAAESWLNGLRTKLN